MPTRILPLAPPSPLFLRLSHRYAELEQSDGLVAQRDAVLPGSPVVWLDEMDHFGPGECHVASLLATATVIDTS